MSHIQRVHDLEFQPSLKYDGLSYTKAEMRLQRLESAPTDDELIQCILENVDMGTGVAYAALSYCWGETSNQRVILVGGQVLNVIQNLYEALRELRAVGVEYVWVDALCINQRDKIEVQQQIQKMTIIYGRAESVFAWLGPGNVSFLELGKTFKRLKFFRNELKLHEKTITQGNVLNDLLRMRVQEIGIFERRRGALKISGSFPALSSHRTEVDAWYCWKRLLGHSIRA